MSDIDRENSRSVDVESDRASDHHEAAPQRSRIATPPELPPATTRKALFVVTLFLVALLAAAAITGAVRISQSRALARETEREAVVAVAVVQPIPERPEVDLVLPGSIQAFQESPIFARTSGYLVRWYKDIGSRVQKGDLLAKIDTPEIDQELNQARASRRQIEAQLKLSQISAERWENLRKSDSVSAQEADQQTSAYQQNTANLAAADANVKRLEQLESFKNVYAPFSGVLTRRNVDPGALINAGAGGREMFDLAQLDPLRVFVNVPQSYTPSLAVGVHGYVTLQELTGQRFEGTVARTSDAIDPGTRSLVVELDVPNPTGTLLPGSFGQVHFNIGTGVRKLTIPVNSMLFRSEGPRVAVVGSDNKVNLRAIAIGRDYGSSLEILSGLTGDEQLIINPSDSIENGQRVQIVSRPDQKSTGQQRGAE